MAFLSTESTPRERLSRLISLLGRVRMYWRSTAILVVVGVALSLVIALNTNRVWRSESTILYRDVIQTGQQQGSAARAARLGPKLKDMLYTRPTLSSVIEEHGLYPEKASRSMVEAVAEMQNHLGFRARDSDSYVISFSHDDPVMAQRVTARLADLMIEEYRRENLTSATMTRDFLRRELTEATQRVDEASRALATFLAKNPQFQWGLGDSPYAPTPQVPGAPGAMPGAMARPQPAAPRRPMDPELASLERRLAQVEAQLNPGAPPAPTDGPLPPNVVEAEKARDAAAAALTAAESALAEKLRTVTSIHPDAISAQSRVEAARKQLASAESALRMVRGGVKPAPTEAASELAPEQRAELEKERATLFRQIAARRSKLHSEGPAEAPRPQPAAASAAAEEPSKDVVELETEWHRLRLDLDRARDYLKTVQANERAANMAAEAAERKSDTEMAILDPAYLPARPDKGRGKVFFVGVALTLMFAFGLAGGRVLLNDTLYDQADVDALGGPQVLAEMPAIPEREPQRARTMVPLTEPPSMDAEPFEAEDDDEESDPQRLYSVTLRWGSPLDPDEAHARPPAPARPAPMVRVAPAPIARVRTPIDPTRSPADDPDVEVIGDDPAEDGEGAFDLLRHAPQHALAALRVLRHRLEQRRGEGRMIVAVVSPGPAEGKTTLAARLAMTLAEADRARVVLVEGNLTRPQVATTLGLKLPSYAGLSRQIRQRMLGERHPLGVVRVGPSLWALAEPSLGATYPDVVHSPHFGAALQSLRRCFDYVIVDGPAVLGSGDANVLEDAADGLVLVARASVTRGSSLTRSLAQLGNRRILGVVLNEVSERPVARKKIETATQDATA